MSARQSAPSAMATARWVEHDTGIMGVPGDPTVLHGHRHGLGQPAAIGQLGQERGTGMADQILPVGYHFGATDRAITVHFQGALLLVDCVAVVTTILPGRRAWTRAPPVQWSDEFIEAAAWGGWKPRSWPANRGIEVGNTVAGVVVSVAAVVFLPRPCGGGI